MKRNRILFLILFSVGLVTAFILKADLTRDFIPFYTGECTLAIPNGYQLGVSSDGYATFTPSLKSGFTDFSIYSITWENNSYKKLKKSFKLINTKIVDTKKIGHLKLITSIDQYNKEHYRIVGDNFSILFNKINKNTKRLMDNCNYTWSNKLSINEQLQQMKENFHLTKEKANIIVNTIKKASDP